MSDVKFWSFTTSDVFNHMSEKTQLRIKELFPGLFLNNEKNFEILSKDAEIHEFRLYLSKSIINSDIETYSYQYNIQNFMNIPFWKITMKDLFSNNEKLQEKFSCLFVDQKTINENTTFHDAGIEGILFSISTLPVIMKEHEEYQYLKLVDYVIENGKERKTERTGTGTISIFGTMSRYTLEDGILPLMTTKKMSFKNILNELIFFIKGKTHANWLKERGCNIWNGNSTRDFLDKQGLCNYSVGELGPIYGYQWRHFGADYKTSDEKTCDPISSNDGIDQLAQVIHDIKQNPESRRLLVTAWNPKDLKKMALPPCHLMYQFYVEEGKYLSCMMYQRSADLGLGVPYNIASYSILTHIVAHLTGLKPKEFIHVIGDCHVYQNHIDPLKNQQLRKPFSFPTLKISPEFQNIDDIDFSFFELQNYQSHPFIKMEMAI